MLDRIRPLAATFAYRFTALAMLGFAFGGMYYLPTRNLLALKIPANFVIAAGGCILIVLCCDLLSAGDERWRNRNPAR
ncbi:hypothetical protein [Haladaptatus sp. DFWS20]|uniref:hypothetical protein n=1 Tax=Haladaptatus sp. DFWS20 TaxID=3403467 RepID=UPI003EBD1BFC